MDLGGFSTDAALLGRCSTAQNRNTDRVYGCCPR